MQRSVFWHTLFVLTALAGITAPAGADVIVASYAPPESSILRFGEDGTLMQPIVPPGGGIVGPAGITFGPDGLLYVSNQASLFGPPGTQDFIAQIDPATGSVTTFITLASGYLPAGLRFGPDGNLYVSRNGGIQAPSGTGTVDCYNGTTGQFMASVVTNLSQPTGLLFDSAGNLYVSSYGDGNIVVYNGTSQRILVTLGTGRLLAPSGLQIGPDGNLYVVDLLLGAIRRYDLSGNFIGGLIPAGGQLSNQFPSDLLFDRRGNLLVADLGGDFNSPVGNVKAFDPVTGDYSTDFAKGIQTASQLLLTP
jgi:DNA-binding beta-propeller fold protein YncE